jgi:hypothetical protein
MEILKDNAFGGTFELTFEPNTSYTVVLTDLYNGQAYEYELESNDDGTIIVTLPSRYLNYDGELTVAVSADTLVFYDSLFVVRPYCNIDEIVNELNGKFTRDQVKEFEMAARYIINSFTGPFEFRRGTVEETGNGTDYLVTPVQIVKVYSILENGQEADTADAFQGMIRAHKDNRTEYRVAWKDRYNPGQFVEGFDYVIDADYGWPLIPNDIKMAGRYLTLDIACGNEVLSGTGNLIVDNILSRYIPDTIRPRVL